MDNISDDFLKDATGPISDKDLFLLKQTLMATLLHPKCKDEAVLIQRALSRLHYAEQENKRLRETVREMTVDEVADIIYECAERDPNWFDAETAAKALAKLGTIRVVGGVCKK